MPLAFFGCQNIKRRKGLKRKDIRKGIKETLENRQRLKPEGQVKSIGQITRSVVLF
jgi:hypothetical protein